MEVLLVKLGLAILPRLPRGFIIRCARLAGGMGFFLARGQRKITLANLEIAFGQGKTAAEKRQIAIRSFQIMALVFLDFFWFARQTHERVNKYVLMDGSIPKYLPPPPAVLVTAHFGNWELMSRAFTAHGYRHLAIVAPLANPEVDVIFNEFRTAGDAEIVSMRGAVRGMLRAIQRRLFVAILLDQNTKPVNGGVFVKFFGLPCPTSNIAAVLAERKNVPIIAAFCRAQWDGYYTCYVLEQFKAGVQAGTNAEFRTQMTQQIAMALQRGIEKYPEQWMWMYKRWKHIEPGRSAGDYPFYAKPLL